jgi:hypothetical protein
MKRYLIILLAVMYVASIYGQGDRAKEKVAIYTDDKSGKYYAEFAGGFLTNAIVKRGSFEACERSADFLKLSGNEQEYQRSGAVNETEIAKLGAQLGVQMVCAVKIGLMDGQPFISAKLIDVETSGIKGSARPTRFTAGDFEGFEQACETITASMFGERSVRGALQGSGSTSSGGDNNRRNGEAYSPDGIEMVYVEGTGSGILAVKGFYIGKYEVTQAQYQAIMGSNPSNFKGSNHPVEMVSWNDAQEFITKLNARTGRNYRLPTEAEWEYAAREGTKRSSYKYSGSDGIGAVAWYADNSGGQTHPVGQKIPNALGIYDMSGNVWEWCQDCYDSSCSLRVFRGGSWGSSAQRCRVAYRSSNSPGDRGNGLGFRVVLP